MLIYVYRTFTCDLVVSKFLERVDGVECIQALKVAKLIGIKNVTQFIQWNKTESLKGGAGRSFPWYVTVPGAMQMLLRRNFGGNEIAAGYFRHLERRSDADRVCMVLELLEEFSPGILDLKPRGRRARKEAA